MVSVILTMLMSLMKNTKKSRPWTPDEERLLTKLYPVYMYEQIAEIMHRSPNSVKTKSKRLGLCC